MSCSVCLFQLCVANKFAPFIGDQFFRVVVLFVCLFVFFQISITSLSPNLSATMTANLETVLPFLVTYIHTYFIRSKRAF